MLYNFIITTPKKRENGSFLGNIYLEEKNNRFILLLPKSLVISNKYIDESSSYIYIKNTKFNNTMYDINNTIINIVKSKCNEWFKNSLNPSLIEEYYTNTIIYDRKHGDLLRLKCIDYDNNIENEKYQSLTITLLNIRFYKQKFVIEWKVQLVNENDILSDVDTLSLIDDNDEDIALPDIEDMNNIKKDYNIKINKKLEEINFSKISILEKINDLETNIKNLNDEITKLNEYETDIKNKNEELILINNEKEFLKLCENLENLL